MIKHIKVVAVLFAAIMMSGCAGLGAMKQVQFQDNAKPDTAMVNIVRRAVFMGDGAKVEVWDGDQFIGTLGAGELLQYEAEPGVHTFMVYVQGSWGVAKGELKAGKSYFLKFNMSGFGPISLGVADSNDPRIAEWKTMKTITIDKAATKEVPEKYIQAARKILTRVENGQANVTQIVDGHAL
ncbi:hypothetical protein DS2_12043 [Catenovulum agarivorans DS-2]|uniref:DUF2846 domain-containing protein n=1 Tax=Catenovulum agarivorans DS-2 TaxID=1328313 RepID=W7QKV0_9ALTE|nr:hypothetical protein [Catenovulum agarivorans]EWH09562.1 hypothetical protein DS2_12043 [Catenovulum agarivorans DS-2]